MINYIFIPNVHFEKGSFFPIYEQYLKDWRSNAISFAEDGKVSASMCIQATLIDLIIEGKLSHDWLGIMDEFLTENGWPLAYSENYGKLLYKYTAQFKQTTVHSIHTKWWISCLTNMGKVDHAFFATLIAEKKQNDGLIYDKDVSKTILRHRMKTELTMSAAMSAEILNAAGILSEKLSLELATELVSPIKCPTLGYMSMEYFRLVALMIMGQGNLFPIGISKHIEACAEGLDVGWSDFSMKSKVDAYMGTAKRSKRDKPIHSPLVACQINFLSKTILDKNSSSSIMKRLNDYSYYMELNPLDIPAFQMRDVPINFGADITPIEIICSSFLISSCQSNLQNGTV